MVKQVLFLQGAGKGAHDADAKLANSLQQELGPHYNVHFPVMPVEEAPDYVPWARAIGEQIEAIGDGVILVGHSFGGSVLLKYLAEHTVVTTVSAIFLMAVPFWGLGSWQYDDFKLKDDFADHIPKAPIFIYQSHTDEVVSFDHAQKYAQTLGAQLRELPGGHQFNNDLRKVAHDIQQL